MRKIFTLMTFLVMSFRIGSCEFIIDKNNNYCFLEINPRIQVEHAVSEMITDIDLIEYQIKISENQRIRNRKA